MEVDELRVDKAGPRYHVDLQVRLDAEPRRAYEVFADFRRLREINPAIRLVESLPGAPPDAQRIGTTVRICVAFFCRELRQVQDMTAEPSAAGGRLTADVLPDRSDLRFGHAQWLVWPCGRQACLRFAAELEPGFWVPPLIGPWAMERKLRAEALETSQNLERLAAAPP